MRCSFSTICLLLFGMAAIGCRQQAAPIPPQPCPDRQPPPAESREVDLAILRYDTGDVTMWPDYHFPLEYSFDLPEVPPEIIGPFPEEAFLQE